MIATLLQKGFVKQGNFFHPITTQQNFRVRMDTSLKPVYFSLYVPWGKRKEQTLWKLLLESSSFEKIQSKINTTDCPPGRLWIGDDLQPYYDI